MMKKIDIMGFRLDDYAAGEAAMQAEPYAGGSVLHIIENISMRTLNLAEQDEAVRQVVETLDLSVIEDREILKAAGAEPVQTGEGTAAHDFAMELLRRLEQDHRTVFLVGETAERVQQNRDELQREFPELAFAGTYALEDCTGDYEAVVNEMNAVTPDLILSVLPTPVQERFIGTHRAKLNVGMWYGMGEHGIGRRPHGIRELFRRRMEYSRLKNSVRRYQEREKEKPAEDRGESQ